MLDFEFLHDGEPIEVTGEKKENGFSFSINGRLYKAAQLGQALYSIECDGVRTDVAALVHKGTCYLDLEGVQLELREPSDDQFGGGAGDHGAEKDKVYAPMPGKIVKLLVAVGDEVAEKQPLVIVEAMKMENQVNAKAAGKVKAVNFKDGDQVDTETPLIELELEDES